MNHSLAQTTDDHVVRVVRLVRVVRCSYSPLTFAALLGQSKILRFMMMAQVDLNQKDLVGRTALYVGTRHTNTRIHTDDDERYSPHDCAASLCNRKDVVRALLESETLDIDMPCTDIRQTALEAAIERNYSEIVAILGRIAGQWLNEAVKRKELARYVLVYKRRASRACRTLGADSRWLVWLVVGVCAQGHRAGAATRHGVGCARLYGLDTTAHCHEDQPARCRDCTCGTSLRDAVQVSGAHARVGRPNKQALAKAGANENAVNMGGKTPFDVAHEYLGDQAEPLIELFKAHKYVEVIARPTTPRSHTHSSISYLLVLARSFVRSFVVQRRRLWWHVVASEPPQEATQVGHLYTRGGSITDSDQRRVEAQGRRFIARPRPRGSAAGDARRRSCRGRTRR